jgi:hypothetical protein
MSDRIQAVTIRPTRLTPTEAEVGIAVHVDAATPGLELHGRLMGPQCLYSTTIEVAYRLKMLPCPPSDPPSLLGRVLIPEPSWWDPQSPFLYAGPVELWEGSQKVAEVRTRCGLHYGRGTGDWLAWNGRPLGLTAVVRSSVRGDELPGLRDAGVNLVVVDADGLADLCDAADEVGMLLAGRADDPTAWLHDPRFHSCRHPSVLGFTANPDGPLTLTGGRGVLESIPRLPE